MWKVIIDIVHWIPWILRDTADDTYAAHVRQLKRHSGLSLCAHFIMQHIESYLSSLIFYSVFDFHSVILIFIGYCFFCSLYRCLFRQASMCQYNQLFPFYVLWKTNTNLSKKTNKPLNKKFRVSVILSTHTQLLLMVHLLQLMLISQRSGASLKLQSLIILHHKVGCNGEECLNFSLIKTAESLNFTN